MSDHSAPPQVMDHHRFKSLEARISEILLLLTRLVNETLVLVNKLPVVELIR